MTKLNAQDFPSSNNITDIVVIGAGISGLVCAQRLRQAGYSVLVLEKSMGVGGRVATRRLYSGSVDHGFPYLHANNEFLYKFVKLLVDRHVIELWTDTIHHHQPVTGLILQSSASCYVSSDGITAIAKFLTQKLKLQIGQRVIKVDLNSENSWCLTVSSNALETHQQFYAKALVIAIPAPQAQDLLTPLGINFLGTDFLNYLNSVEFNPCLSVMAGYSPHSQPLPNWQALTFNDNPDLAWMGFDSSKREEPLLPHFVVQSTPQLAQQHLETKNLESVGNYILQTAATVLSLPWLTNPEWMQVHPWRYAFPRNPLDVTSLSATTPLPLVCCGDWCGGNLITGAILSGLSAADKIDQQLRYLLPQKADFLDFLGDEFTKDWPKRNVRSRKASSQPDSPG